MKKNTVNIDLTQVPKYQMELLCHDILDGCKKFYADPENVKKYEEWKSKKMLNRVDYSV